MNDKLISLIRFFYAQCVFNNKCFYSAYSRMVRMEEKRRKLVYWISSITFLVIILQLCVYQIPHLEESKNIIVNIILVLNIIGLLATASSLLYELFTKEDITEKRLEYKRIAEDYKDLRDQHMCLIESYLSGSLEEETARTRLNELITDYDRIAKYGPTTTINDYKEAQKQLGIGDSENEGFIWPDDQINKLLPRSLWIE